MSHKLCISIAWEAICTCYNKSICYIAYDPCQKGSIKVKFATVWNSLRDFVPLQKQTDWSIDKLSCKNLFKLLVLELLQFFTLYLKYSVGMYKIKKVGNNKQLGNNE